MKFEDRDAGLVQNDEKMLLSKQEYQLDRNQLPEYGWLWSDRQRNTF